jgi:hypothetical protein
MRFQEFHCHVFVIEWIEISFHERDVKELQAI